MNSLDVFSARDLRLRAGELLRGAEEGNLALVTKHGRPAIVAVPFDARLVELGVSRALALHLFERGQLSLAQAAKVGGLSLEAFIELLGTAGIAAVDYASAELDEELAVVD